MSKDETIGVKFAEKQKELDAREAHINDLEAQAEKNLLETEKRLKMANTSSEDYLKYQSKWMETHGYSRQCFNDYCNYRGLQDDNVQSKGLDNGFSL